MRCLSFFLFLCLVFCSAAVHAQDDEPRTIRVKRESSLSKAIFDNTSLELVIMDRYGNPRENQVLSYKFYVKTKKETREFSGFSNSLSGDMVNFLNKQKKAVKIFFTEIRVKDDHGHVVDLPDVIDTWFPDCANCLK